MLAPICLFTYNRLDETQQTVEALKLNDLAKESELIIFSDGAKNDRVLPDVTEVRNYLQTINGFKTIEIIESPVNKGLANSIIDGVTKVIGKYGKVIVLEDDLLSTPHFLNFMNQALDFYESEMQIQSINGYSLSLLNKKNETYFQIRPFPWGWGTWANRWNRDIFNKEKIKTELETNDSILKEFRKACGDDISEMLLDSIHNKNNSWYVRWTFDHFRNNNYSVYPEISYIENIGHNPNGTHCKGINPYLASTSSTLKTSINLSIFKIPDQRTTKEFLWYFSFWHKLMVRIKLIPSKTGRSILIEDFKNKIGFK